MKSKEYNARQRKDTAYETLLNKYREYYKEGKKEEQKKNKNALRTKCSSKKSPSILKKFL